jgi:hypothetical protein
VTYVRPDIVVDEDATRSDVYAFVQSQVPGWQPRTGNFEVVLIEAFIRKVTEQLANFAAVPDEIFIAFGQSILGIAPDPAVAATATARFTLSAAAPGGGFAIPLGTDIAVLQADNTYAGFTTTTGITIASGGTTGDVTVAAVVPGAAANGLTGTAIMLDSIAGIASVSLLTTATGGADAQTIDSYLNDLQRRLQLLSLTPITPTEFATAAELEMELLGSPGRALPMDLYDAATNTSSVANTISIAIQDLSGAHQPSGIKTSVDAYLQSVRQTNFVVEVVDQLDTTLTVVVNVTKVASAVSTQVHDDVLAAVTAYLSPANWGAAQLEGDPTWTSRPVVPFNGIIAAAGSVLGVASVTSATLNGGTSNVTMQSGKPHAVPASTTSTYTTPTSITVNVS